MTVPPSSPSPLAAVAIWRAVELIEEDGPLDDTAALRQAIAARSDDRARLLERARLLGQRLGLDREWARWQRLGAWVLLGLALLVATGSWLLAQGLLGSGRQINAVAALLSLLGLHALSWLLWFCSLFVRWGGGAGGSGALLGRLALRLTARLPLDRGPHALQLARATTDVLVRARLAPWAFGAISHLAWALSFAVLLLGLLAGFALRAYTLGWETTILAPDTLAGFVRASGWLPARLGFPVPDAQTLQQGGAEGDPRTWAWWLIGSVAVYGLALRLLSAACCALAWHLGKSRLAPDLATPYARRLLARMAALTPVQVLDEEHPNAAPAVAMRTPASAAEGTRAIGFELPPELHWPGPSIDGSQSQREAFLQSLTAEPPRRLLVACHAPSTPDRGTARFLREAAALAGETALLPIGRAADTRRWREWLASTDLAGIGVHEDADHARAWLAEQAP